MSSRQTTALIVLPPKRPQYNGCVERANRTVRQEFYLFYAGEPTMAGVNEGLVAYLKCYNEYRPHQAPVNPKPKCPLFCKAVMSAFGSIQASFVTLFRVVYGLRHHIGSFATRARVSASVC